MTVMHCPRCYAMPCTLPKQRTLPVALLTPTTLPIVLPPHFFTSVVCIVGRVLVCWHPLLESTFSTKES